MRITNELRDYIWDYATSKETWLDIADRIDAEHESACAEAYGNGVESVALPDLTAYVKLPLDADGVPIRVGDNVTEHEDGHTFKVDGFMDWDGEWWVFMRDGIQAPASRCTHHHAPTVEDVLRKFAVEVCGEPALTIRSGVVEEYAAKLRLAGES